MIFGASSLTRYLAGSRSAVAGTFPPSSLVFFVGQHRQHRNRSHLVVYVGYQPGFVVLDIEHDAVSTIARTVQPPRYVSRRIKPRTQKASSSTASPDGPCLGSANAPHSCRNNSMGSSLRTFRMGTQQAAIPVMTMTSETIPNAPRSSGRTPNSRLFSALLPSKPIIDPRTTPLTIRLEAS